MEDEDNGEDYVNKRPMWIDWVAVFAIGVGIGFMLACWYIHLKYGIPLAP